ncbi:MAG: hypothetical protein B6241_05595 [Spirochaetaceae bacterium 4572_59]|nr:MAG: hypothetical protein B6241_05595 [Spirochaetaceae bacterium 4572_59]
MAIVTKQLISQLYEKYKSIDVSFNKDVVKTTGLQPKKVYLKFKDRQRPCVLYSCSFESARIIVALTDTLVQRLQDNETNLSLRFSFLRDETPKPIEHNFFIQSRLISHSILSEDQPNLYILTLSYSTRPPDDLIETLGFLLEANVNATKRKEERILITVDSMKTLRLGSKNCILCIDSIPRKGILRDLSFSGCKIIIQGNAKFLINKTVFVKMISDKGESFQIKGKILRFEEVQGRRDLAVIALYFALEDLSLSYKMMINNYLFNR